MWLNFNSPDAAAYAQRASARKSSYRTDLRTLLTPLVILPLVLTLQLARMRFEAESLDLAATETCHAGS